MSCTPKLYLSTRSRLRSTQPAPALPVAAPVSTGCPPGAAVDGTPKLNKFQAFVGETCPRPFNKSPTAVATATVVDAKTAAKKAKVSTAARDPECASDAMDENTHLEAKMGDVTLEPALVQPADTLPIQEQDPEQQVVEEQTDTPEPQVAHPLVEGGNFALFGELHLKIMNSLDVTQKCDVETGAGSTVTVAKITGDTAINDRNKSHDLTKHIVDGKIKFQSDLVEAYKALP